jgi:hypothetical protein
MLPEVVTASRVSSRPTTVHGWRPTSVTTHPVSSDTTASSPLTAAQRKNQRLRGRSRRRHQASANHSPRPSSRKALPTITSNDRCTALTSSGRGRTSAGMASSPRMRVEGLKPASSDAPLGRRSP